jgi:hypothetical protein
VLVIFFVTGIAVFWSLFEHCTFVTLFALHLGVFAQQRKRSGFMVELGRFLPAALAMATAALLAQCLFVFIVFLVAGNTLLDQFVAVQASCVAVFASRTAVLATQRVFGVRVVIKAVASPLFSAVTGIALFTKLTFMPFLVIYFAVASVAILGSFFVDVVLVAIHALGIGMFAG